MKYIAHMLKGSAKIVSADTVLHIQGGDVFSFRVIFHINPTGMERTKLSFCHLDF